MAIYFFNTLKFHCLLFKQVQGQFMYLFFFRKLSHSFMVTCKKAVMIMLWIKLTFSVLSGTWLILCSHKCM